MEYNKELRIFTIKEEKVLYSKEYEAKWKSRDPSVVPQKLLTSWKKSGKKRAEWNDLPANFLKIKYQKAGYKCLLSEMDEEVYKPFESKIIEKYVGKDKYADFIKTYKTLRKVRLIRQDGGFADLLVWKKNGNKITDLFFVEAKRITSSNRDELRENQMIVASLFKSILEIDTKAVAVVIEDYFEACDLKEYKWQWPKFTLLEIKAIQAGKHL